MYLHFSNSCLILLNLNKAITRDIAETTSFTERNKDKKEKNSYLYFLNKTSLSVRGLYTANSYLYYLNK